MPLMRSRWSGALTEVTSENVAARLASGYTLVGDYDPADAPEPPKRKTFTTVRREDEPPKREEPKADEPKPDEDSTIAEIRAYAKRHGIDLPSGGRKADLLALL